MGEAMGKRKWQIAYDIISEVVNYCIWLQAQRTQSRDVSPASQPLFGIFFGL
jgi:hypothetical protein